VPALGEDGWYHLKDKHGQDWKWTEPNWLKEWVRRVNAGVPEPAAHPLSFNVTNCVGWT
jgi:hypothetical protein